VQGDSDAAGEVLHGSIGGYAKAAGTYKCPADVKGISPGPPSTPRVRSVSANNYLGCNPYEAIANAGNSVNTSYKIFYKFSQFNGYLSSSDCFEFLDENPLSINDGFFRVVEGGSPGDIPAVNHGNSSSFSFVDGHVQLHKWVDAFLLLPVNTSLTSQDQTWLTTHATYKLQ
jgi:prepilin-type processing-associated H-X9-DG protein